MQTLCRSPSRGSFAIFDMECASIHSIDYPGMCVFLKRTARLFNTHYPLYFKQARGWPVSPRCAIARATLVLGQPAAPAAAHLTPAWSARSSSPTRRASSGRCGPFYASSCLRTLARACAYRCSNTPRATNITAFASAQLCSPLVRCASQSAGEAQVADLLAILPSEIIPRSLGGTNDVHIPAGGPIAVPSQHRRAIATMKPTHPPDEPGPKNSGPRSAVELMQQHSVAGVALHRQPLHAIATAGSSMSCAGGQSAGHSQGSHPTPELDPAATPGGVSLLHGMNVQDQTTLTDPQFLQMLIGSVPSNEALLGMVAMNGPMPADGAPPPRLEHGAASSSHDTDVRPPPGLGLALAELNLYLSPPADNRRGQVVALNENAFAPLLGEQHRQPQCQRSAVQHQPGSSHTKMWPPLSSGNASHRCGAHGGPGNGGANGGGSFRTQGQQGGQRGDDDSTALSGVVLAGRACDHVLRDRTAPQLGDDLGTKRTSSVHEYAMPNYYPWSTTNSSVTSLSSATPGSSSTSSSAAPRRSSHSTLAGTSAATLSAHACSQSEVSSHSSSNSSEDSNAIGASGIGWCGQDLSHSPSRVSSSSSSNNNWHANGSENQSSQACSSASSRGSLAGVATGGSEHNTSPSDEMFLPEPVVTAPEGSARTAASDSGRGRMTAQSESSGRQSHRPCEKPPGGNHGSKVPVHHACHTGNWQYQPKCGQHQLECDDGQQCELLANLAQDRLHVQQAHSDHQQRTHEHYAQLQEQTREQFLRQQALMQEHHLAQQQRMLQQYMLLQQQIEREYQLNSYQQLALFPQDPTFLTPPPGREVRGDGEKIHDYQPSPLNRLPMGGFVEPPQPSVHRAVAPPGHAHGLGHLQSQPQSVPFPNLRPIDAGPPSLASMMAGGGDGPSSTVGSNSTRPMPSSLLPAMSYNPFGASLSFSAHVGGLGLSRDFSEPDAQPPLRYGTSSDSQNHQPWSTINKNAEHAARAAANSKEFP